MNPIIPNRLRAQVKLKNPNSMTRALQVLLPISLLSFLLSHYSSCIPCFLHQLNLALKQFVNWKSMLLLSNIILLFITKDFSLFRSSNIVADDLFDEFIVGEGHHELENRGLVVVEESVVEEKIIEECVKSLKLVLVQKEEEEEGLMEVMEADEMEFLEIEELNRRFEEFIQKEKRKWRSEALQLVMV